MDDIQDSTLPVMTGGNDWQLAQQKLARRQKILDALQAQAMTPDQGQFISNGVGTFYAGGGPLAALGKGVQQYMVGKQQKQLDTDSQGAFGQQQAALADAVQSYQKTAQTDPRAAAIQAVASSFPQLQKLGAESLKAIEAGKIQPKDLVSASDPDGIPALIQNGVSGFKPKPAELKSVGGVVYDANNNIIELKGKPGGPERVTLNGDLYEKNPSTGELRKLDNAAKITSNVRVAPTVNVVNKGESKFMETLGENTAKQVNAVQQAKIDAQKRLTVADRLEHLNSSGVFSGQTANAANFMANLADTVGVKVDKAKLANSQEYAATLGKQVSDVLTAGSGVGRSMTDADREAFMTQFPTMVNTPEGRQRIIGLLRDGARQDIQYSDQVHANMLKSYPDAANLMDLTPATKSFPDSNPAASSAPAKDTGAPKGSAANPMSYEEYQAHINKRRK